MRALVTGGAGYIGSVVVEALLDARCEVVVYDNLGSGHADAVAASAKLIHADLLDTARLTATLKEYRIDVVIHMAAHSLVSASMRDPIAYYRNNVQAGLSLLEAMREANTHALVFSSTAAVYGEPEVQPIDETAPLRPTNTYGQTKVAFEEALPWYEQAYSIRWISLRYFNAAGASAQNGERHHPETHLIPLVLRAAAGLSPEIIIYGDDYPTPDGTCIRDYVHVVDLARAHVLAATALMNGHRSRVYNLGCGGDGFSVRQVISAAEEITGLTVPVRVGPRRAGDPPVLVASNSRIQSELGWHPQHRGLHTIITDAWRFMAETATIEPPIRRLQRVLP